MPHIQWPLLIFALVLASTVVVVVRSTPHRRYCGRHLTKALIALCGTVKAPSSGTPLTQFLLNSCALSTSP
ncbi:unnamed protein product [Heligmosomoides polygyrus]|uniref:Secreted protein n=1 Tax=Heligmosomoides polygyrus TaxID=6339 RepID=A0A183GMZ8_HELPZ|nr:unnamed protein product [Heligmosomoides polygyrus]